MKDKKLIVLGLGILGFLAAFYFVFFLKEGVYHETPVQKKSEEVVRDFSHWVTYNSQVGKFSASFPKEPVHSSEAVNIREGNGQAAHQVFISQEPDGTVVMVRVVEYPADYKITDSWEVVREPFDKLVGSDGRNVAREIRKTEYEGNEALIFQVENPDIRMKGETILAGQTLYTLIYVSPERLFDDKVWEEFISSFVIKK